VRDWTNQYIDGKWVPSASGDTVDVVNPTTEEVVARVAAGHRDDIDRAVTAAAGAFAMWSSTDPSERSRLLRAMRDLVSERRELFAQIITTEVGTPIRTARVIQAGLGVVDLDAAIKALETYQWREPLGNSVVVREPIGVVGAITPWNYPLHQITAKIGAALGAGCTVVLKPSEVAPGCAMELLSIANEVGFPPGVINMVCGFGPIVGEALAAHPQVDMITFTGSNAVGKRVFEVAAGTVKRVALELGGKSPSLIAEDADLADAVAHTVRGCLINGGQSCSALTRMVVPRRLLPEAERQTLDHFAAYQPRDPADPDSRLGPLVSATQRDRVLSYIEAGLAEGARLLTGGKDRPAEAPPTGYFVAPTVFSEVDSVMTIAQEEIFGPVLSLQPYDDEDEGVAIANSTRFGLAAAVFSGSPERAESLAVRLRAAQVAVNGGQFNAEAPFGGYKQSGLGREGGKFGFEEFLEVKSLQF
jgi:betaine-aldehyde dehydrogenase